MRTQPATHYYRDRLPMPLKSGLTPAVKTVLAVAKSVVTKLVPTSANAMHWSNLCSEFGLIFSKSSSGSSNTLSTNTTLATSQTNSPILTAFHSSEEVSPLHPNVVVVTNINNSANALLNRQALAVHYNQQSPLLVIREIPHKSLVLFYALFVARPPYSVQVSILGTNLLYRMFLFDVH